MIPVLRHARAAVRARGTVAAVAGGLVLGLATPGATAYATIPGGEAPPASAPKAPWQDLFVDNFDGPAGVWPDQWHHMTDWNAATLNGLGQLEVGHVAQIRSTAGWMLPVGTQVKVSASLLMPNTGSNYAALWVQHPDALDPREIDVIESYGPLKTAGAQAASHLCYDVTLDDAVDECGAAGLSPEMWSVTDAFPAGAKPWETFWEYTATFTVGGDTVEFEAEDGWGNQSYAFTSPPDPRRVPGNVVPFHLRLSNKDVEPEHRVAGGDRFGMLVDWVRVQVQYPAEDLPQETTPETTPETTGDAGTVAVS